MKNASLLKQKSLFNTFLLNKIATKKYHTNIDQNFILQNKFFSKITTGNSQENIYLQMNFIFF